MSPEEKIIRESMDYARRMMKGIHSSHGWDHVMRVLNIAERIAQTEAGSDIFIVRVAAILHDIARKLEDSDGGKTCHAEAGSIMAREFLLECGLDGGKTDRICSCILTHRFRDDRMPASIEGRIIFDADKLDSIGAVGIGRAFLFSGEIGARLHNTGDAAETAEAYSEEDTAYREYAVKLRFVKDRMLTAEGKRLARERHSFMIDFFDRLEKEAGGDL
ncbi:MAG: HD domain-containing protein [Spirochaetes bacterium]|jgi:uncharacterized protein|nr:HD domain-containing protein [Spirochaetota bacterium]